MEIRQTLIDIANDSRGWLKVWAKDFTADEASRSAGPTGPNPLAWQLGHLACVDDDVHQLFSDTPTIVPAELRAVCATGSPGPMSSTSYPPLAELWTLLERTHTRLLHLVEQADASDLDRPPLETNPYFRTLGQAVYEVALHQTYHVGEIATLRKALGKTRIG